MDPGALGTLIIGLESIRREDALYARAVPQPARSRRQRRDLRLGVAAILRRTAEFIEPTPAPAL